MLDLLKRVLQNVLIWLLLFINGGKLPPELQPPVNIPDTDWSALIGQSSQWQLQMPASVDGADALSARKAQASRAAVLPNAGQVAKQEEDFLPASLGSLDALATDRTALAGAMTGGIGNALAALDPSAPVVNPSGVPRELLGAVYPWRARGNGRSGSAVTTEIVAPSAPASGRATLALILLGVGALAVAGYSVVRRRR